MKNDLPTESDLRGAAWDYWDDFRPLSDGWKPAPDADGVWIWMKDFDHAKIMVIEGGEVAGDDRWVQEGVFTQEDAEAQYYPAIYWESVDPKEMSGAWKFYRNLST